MAEDKAEVIDSQIIAENVGFLDNCFDNSFDLQSSLVAIKEYATENHNQPSTSKLQGVLASKKTFSSTQNKTLFMDCTSGTDSQKVQQSNDKVEVISKKLKDWGLPDEIAKKYEERGIAQMFDWQVSCLGNAKVLRDCCNLVYSAPTSAGKTLVAEILTIKTLLERQKRVIIILPFVSIVREKMFYLQSILSSSGIRVEGFMGSKSPPGGLQSVHVAICTIEKANSLVNRLLDEGNISELGAVIVDELHLLGDPHRGYILELLLTKIKFVSSNIDDVNIQIVGMSATLPNLEVLATWLDAELFITQFRPIPLEEFCLVGNKLYDKTGKIIKTIQDTTTSTVDGDNVLNICLDTIKENCSVLIFCMTKNRCENLAQSIALSFYKMGCSGKEMGSILRSQLKPDCIAEVLEQLKNCPVGLDPVVKKTVSFGVAYHHAGLTFDERDIIEGAFKSGAIRVLVATSTLSSGVNLPARKVIIRTPVFQKQPINILTYKQMIGRAGRMGKDTKGESILICTEAEKKIGFDLMMGALDPVISCIESEDKYMRAILEMVASQMACTKAELDLYSQCTLLFTQQNIRPSQNSLLANTLKELKNYELIREQLDGDDIKYVATPLGKACLSSSMAPNDGLSLFCELQKARQCLVLETDLHLIYLVTPYSVSSQWGDIDWLHLLTLWESLTKAMKRVGELVGVQESFIIRCMRGVNKMTNVQNKLNIHKRFYTALALQDLVNEVPLSEVATKFQCARGFLQSLQQAAATFAGMVTSFCHQLGWKSMEMLISQFQDRLHFGISSDLIELMKLPSLNGLRARSLFDAGFETISNIASADSYLIENALHKAVPFQSEKERDGDDSDDIRKRNKIKSIWITGFCGITIKEAAENLITEARKYLELEIGVAEIKWEKKSNVNASLSNSISSNVTCKDKVENPQNDSASTTKDKVESRPLTESETLSKNPIANTTEKCDTEKIILSANSCKPIVDLKVTQPIYENIKEDFEKKCAIEDNDIQTVKDANEISSSNSSPGISKHNSPVMTTQFKSKNNHTVSKSRVLNNVSNTQSTLTKLFREQTENSQKGSAYATRLKVESSSFTEFDISIQIPVTKTTEKSETEDILLSPNVSNSNIKEVIINGYGDNVSKLKENMRKQRYSNNVDDARTVKAANEFFSFNSSSSISEFNSPQTTPQIVPKKNLTVNKSKVLKLTNTRSSPSILDDDIIWDSMNFTEGVIANITKSRTTEKYYSPNISFGDDDFHESEETNVDTKVISTHGASKSVKDVSLFSSEGDNSSLFEESFPVELPSNLDDNITQNSIRNKLVKQETATDFISMDSESILKAFKTTIVEVDSEEDIKLVYEEDNRLTEQEIESGLNFNFSQTIEETQLSVETTVDSSVKSTFKRRALDRKHSLQPSAKKAKIRKPTPIPISTLLNTVTLNLKLNSSNSKVITLNVSKHKLTCYALKDRDVVDNMAQIETLKEAAIFLDIETYTSRPSKVIGGNIIDQNGCGTDTNGVNIEPSIKQITIYSGSIETCISLDLTTLGSQYKQIEKNFESWFKKIKKLKTFSLKSDYVHFKKCFNIDLPVACDDISLAEWLTDSDEKVPSVLELMKKYCSVDVTTVPIKVDRVTKKYKLLNSMESACIRAWCIWEVAEKQGESLLEQRQLMDIETRIARILGSCEYHGLRVDKGLASRLLVEVQKAMELLQDKASSMCGHQLNLHCSKDIAKALGMYRAARKVSTKKSVLTSHNHPLASVVIYWRKLRCILSNTLYPLTMKSQIYSDGDRINPYYIMRTCTGRISMHEPNLQSVPRPFSVPAASLGGAAGTGGAKGTGDVIHFNCRNIFVATPGFTLVAADYCQLEMRILTHYSKDEVLTTIMRSDADVFRSIAASWGDIAEEQVDDDLRQKAKQLCYGILYGMGNKALAQSLDVTESEAAMFMADFYKTYPRIQGFTRTAVEECRRKGYVETLMKRRRYLPDINSSHAAKKNAAERKAVNTTIQGSAADIAKAAMCAIDEQTCRQTNPPRLVLQMHDELIYEVPERNKDSFTKLLKSLMEQTVRLNVPLPVKVRSGPTWGTLQEVKF